MSFSAPRLTIYALLSSVEEDLRSLLVEHARLENEAEPTLGGDLYPSAVRRYTDENGTAPAEPTLSTLLPYVDIGDLLALLNRHKNGLPHHIGKHLKSLTPQLERLLPIRKRIAHIRPFRYDDLARVTSFTDQVSAEHPSLWRSVTETAAKLARDPAFVFDLPLPRYEEPPNSAFHNLPLPEFDDTGFLGREAEVKTVMALCKGVWPVVSLVGEGGLGKTALALQCVYDLLDDPSSPFDAIIWSSSKTTRLDSVQIREIDGAIRDSLGLFTHIAKVLGVPSTDIDTLDEILEYLTTGKVLVTSRIGLGEFEYRVNVQPLPNVEASRLLRAVAKLSGVRALANLEQSALAEMCTRMQNNPLFIKWFVSAVTIGCNPRRCLGRTSSLLGFLYVQRLRIPLRSCSGPHQGLACVA